MFCERNKSLSLYLTIPLTTATTERFFSLINQTKTYLCTMNQRRLNHVIIPRIHRKIRLTWPQECLLWFCFKKSRQKNLFRLWIVLLVHVNLLMFSLQCVFTTLLVLDFVRPNKHSTVIALLYNSHVVRKSIVVIIINK